MEYQNAFIDLNATYHLQGKIFKRKLMDPQKLHTAGWFGLAGLTYAFFPYVALQIGANLTTILTTSFSLGGMYSLYRPGYYINSIEMIKEGEHTGKIKLNIQTSLIENRDIIADVKNTQSALCLNNDDLGEEDLENNVIQMSEYLDCKTGTTEQFGVFVLPADGYKDYNLLDWVISLKPNKEDSLSDDFTDLMMSKFDSMNETGGINNLQLNMAQAGY